MREIPILFSGPMVRAILAGRKTQTRRVMRPQPPPGADRLYGPVTCPYGAAGDRLWVRETWAIHSYPCEGHGCGYVLEWAADHKTREIAWDGRVYPVGPTGNALLDFCIRKADKGGRPSIHMPRWASRLTLEVEEVRVQRLQNISEADARAEGALTEDEYDEIVERGGNSGVSFGTGFLYRKAFERLWNEINASRGFAWAANPWVWCVTFRRVEVPRG